MLPTIYQTTDYDQFRVCASNREISRENILVKSIREKNMLAYNPIICTQDFQVIDGQHRLEAARELKVPIYYILANDVEESDIPLLQNQRFWHLKDYVKFYSIVGNHATDYQFLKMLSEKYPAYPISFLAQICSSSTDASQCVRDGRFKVTKGEAKSMKRLEMVQELISNMGRICSKRSFRVNEFLAVGKLVCIDRYSHENMLSQINRYGDDVIEAFKLNSAKNIFERLLVAYNKNKKKEKFKL